MRAAKNALGWDNAFATNHIGPFVLVNESRETGVYYDEKGPQCLAPRSYATRSSRFASSPRRALLEAFKHSECRRPH